MSNQMTRYGEALMAYARGDEPAFYAGEHTRTMAAALNDDIDLVATGPVLAGYYAGNRNVVAQSEDLDAFGVQFDSWSRESDLLQGSAHSELTRRLRAGDVVAQGRNGTVCGICASPRAERTPCSFCDRLVTREPSQGYGDGVASEADIMAYNSSPPGSFLRYSEDADPRL